VSTGTFPSTASVASVAAGTARRARGLAPIYPGARVCGPAVTCRCAVGDNLALHRLLATAPAGSVLVCDAGGRDDVGYFGELMALDARNRRLLGLVIDGAVRDSAALREIDFPVFHRGVAPGRATKSLAPALGEGVALSGVPVSPGDAVVADGDGVLVVPALEWEWIREQAERLDDEERQIRDALGRGQRLAPLIGIEAREDTA
jgi:4-hydroxy-4-methyl-2-oxoglutarate aldolase